MFRSRKKPKTVRVYLAELEAQTLLEVMNRDDFRKMKFNLTEDHVLNNLKDELILWKETLKATRS